MNYIYLLIAMLFLSACDEDSTFVDRGEILLACEEVELHSGDKVVSNTPNPEDTEILITHDIDNKKTLIVIKGEVKLTRAE